MQEPLVNIGIMTEEEISIIFFGEYRCADFGKTISGEFNAKIASGKINVRGGINNFQTTKEIVFDPVDFDSDSFMLKDVPIGIKFHWEKKENQRFHGALKLKMSGEKIIAINIIPAEDYLASVISSEMNPSGPFELLKTHAIISRSWLLNIVESSGQNSATASEREPKENQPDEIIKWYGSEEHADFHVCADDHCQRYHGINKVINDNAYKAIEQTRGLILQYEDKICDTRYSKCCGGITENFENVWEPVPKKYLRKIFDYKFEQEGFNTDLTNERNAVKWILGNPSAFCNTANKKILSTSLVGFDFETIDFFRWRVIYTQQELSAIILEKSGIDFGEIIDLIPVERGHSGRLVKLKIIGSKEKKIIGKELEIRRVLSRSHLYSSAIVIEKNVEGKKIPSSFTIYGAGWGHGVGLCQIGAAIMASKGYMFDEILLHYFKGANIKKEYS
ncbi:MAG: SpoIID/LytB domain-containing protein [bacterium]